MELKYRALISARFILSLSKKTRSWPRPHRCPPCSVPCPCPCPCPVDEAVVARYSSVPTLALPEPHCFIHLNPRIGSTTLAQPLNPRVGSTSATRLVIMQANPDFSPNRKQQWLDFVGTRFNVAGQKKRLCPIPNSLCEQRFFGVPLRCSCGYDCCRWCRRCLLFEGRVPVGHASVPVPVPVPILSMRHSWPGPHRFPLHPVPVPRPSR
jgi:hypothetical protein